MHLTLPDYFNFAKLPNRLLRDAAAGLLAMLWWVQGLAALSYPANSHYGEIIPNALYVTIYDRKIAGAKNADAWTLVTDGLKAVGQDELMLTILNPGHESYEKMPRAPIGFFKTVYDLAKSGKTVHGGDFTRFAKGFLVAPQFKGLIYLQGSPPDGVLAPLGSLTALPLTTEELDAFEIGGPLRVTSELSVQSSYFPYPEWCDQKRESVFSASDIDEMKKEPLLQSNRMPLNDASMIAGSAGYQFVVPLKAQPKLADILQRLPEKSAILLWLGLAPSADAVLAWHPKGTIISTAPKSKAERRGGSYVWLVPGASKSRFEQFIDGYLIMLTNEQWKQFKDAVHAKQDLKLEDAKNAKFVLLMDRRPVPDMNSRSITKTPGWVEFAHGKTAQSKDKIIAKQAANTILSILKTDDQVIKQSISVDDLSAYMKNLERATAEYFTSLGQGPQSHELVLQVHLEPRKKVSHKIWHRPAGIPDEVIRGLYAKVQQIDPPDAVNTLDFELVMTVWR